MTIRFSNVEVIGDSDKGSLGGVVGDKACLEWLKRELGDNVDESSEVVLFCFVLLKGMPVVGVESGVK